jgi:glycosyltransferase involved in cell wall biosynthesis
MDGYVTPGEWAKDYVRAFAPSSQAKPMLHLPNVVDETRFEQEVERRRQGVSSLRQRWEIDASRAVILTPARLDPIKGIRETLEAFMTASWSNEVTWLVAGDGPLRQELITKAQSSGTILDVRFLGHLPEDAILDLLALSDAFLLPSLGDPYPLAVIEAMFARLPVLLSNRVGCHPEALLQGQNGFLFDPLQGASIDTAVAQFLQLDQRERRAMGTLSWSIADKKFRTKRVVSDFVDQLLLVS